MTCKHLTPSGPTFILVTRLAAESHLCSLSHVEQVATQYLVLSWFAPTVPRGFLHRDDKARATSIVSRPNDLQVGQADANQTLVRGNLKILYSKSKGAPMYGREIALSEV